MPVIVVAEPIGNTKHAAQLNGELRRLAIVAQPRFRHLLAQSDGRQSERTSDIGDLHPNSTVDGIAIDNAQRLLAQRIGLAIFFARNPVLTRTEKYPDFARSAR